MHPQLILIVAQQHIADLRRATDHDRLVQAATTASRSHAPTGGLPAAAAVMLIRRLRRRLAQRTRPHGKAGQVEG